MDVVKKLALLKHYCASATAAAVLILGSILDDMIDKVGVVQQRTMTITPILTAVVNKESEAALVSSCLLMTVTKLNRRLSSFRLL